jgi:hypothetical protein
MSQEEIGLRGARARVRMGKVIASSDEPGRSGTSVMAREAAVDVRGTLGCLVNFATNNVSLELGTIS